MSKGTKQIRFGRIQQIIDRLNLERAFYLKEMDSPSRQNPSSQTWYEAQIDRIDSVVKELEALGE